MHRTFLTITAAIVLAGCSSTPVNQASAKKVPASRIFAFQADLSGGAKLVVSRDKGFWASGGCYATVLIDGRKAARIDTGETVSFKLKPGRHIIGIAGDDEGNGVCALQIGQPVKETSTELRVGDMQKFRVSGTQNGSDIRPSSL
ncbi:hypothetical protein [Pseudomonas corrugata]|uniref:hypothetical protein n=1 Tax=Pseudomonas corrugata TaxID=47879 RepID=UPI0006D8BE61|nr:hypothetical protein [Pseudomonas corrugata]